MASVSIREIRNRQRVTRQRGGAKKTPGRVPKPKYPRAIELDYERLMLAAMRKIRARIFSEDFERRMRRLAETYNPQKEIKRDAIGDDFEDDLDAIGDFIDDVAEAAFASWSSTAATIGRRIADHVRDSIVKSFLSGVGIRPTGIEASRDTQSLFVRRNVDLVQSVSSEIRDRMTETLTRNISGGRRWEDIAPQLTQQFGFTESRARLIARDQVSKYNGEAQRATQIEAGITRYRWSTSLDDRVRESHRENEFQIFEWDSPPPETGHPGEDVQCRCVAIPVIDLDSDGEAVDSESE